MSEDPLVSELRAACASLVSAIAGAEAKDWAMAEQCVMDAQERAARILRELALKQEEPPSASFRPTGDTDL